MVLQLKELATTDLLSPGHRLCAGCGPAAAVKMAMKGARGPTIVSQATGCVEVGTTIFPYTSWRLPWIHTLFENAAATASGIEAAYKSLLKQKKLDKPVDIIAIGGDGGTFDIGLQALSGALERRHDFVYLCYDNEAYMNTGVQRSASTPYGASTTTSPSGKYSIGKLQPKKDVVKIAAAHNIPYAAYASIAYPTDLEKKVKKALGIKGPKYLQVYSSCPIGWGIKESKTIEIARVAVETGIWVLCEYESGKFKLNFKRKKDRRVLDYFKVQKRFKHLSQQNIEDIQKMIDARWSEFENPTN